MRLTGKELDRLTIFTLAEFARRRRSRGTRLNAPEAAAVIVDEILEWAWDGVPLSEVIERARSVLARDDVMEGIPEMLESVQVEATFPDGTKLVTIHDPIQ